ncbi:sigma-54 dependent transcriptional regulator [Kordiimonas sp. SCSIO 12610]|uniref:sigma-54-dependent transcriptional regulator n=1 Tax=Kordiimonas sp. SCSIO 12610 TaxID=2829597 RepID=UPI00210EE311|nr:sigma-54 dependent transcriptional regulator [Kordiimonas sp. SCSIO 12610]UTW55020.1 sigma-54-dependent Fis family transcriptional regulator [Kordiimonas sp. SCSIO 12610]
MTKKDGKILIVDDDEDILIAGKLLLKRHYAKVISSNQPHHIPMLMGEHDFDAILLDMNFSPGASSGDQGFLWLEKILEIDPDAVVVLITAHGGVDMAVEAMKRGATDFIAKPWQNEKVIATLSSAVKLRRSRSEADSLKKTNKVLKQASGKVEQPIIGSSPATSTMLSLIKKSAPTDANVLILGENGTGKELAARKIHEHSLRQHEVFMSVDMGTITESLFESELFGHKKGAFTGANENKVGLFQAANGGTLFLDEIGNLPLHLQSKLLTVLEQRKITPVGDTKAHNIDVRIIAATNVSKEKLLDETVFRPDLLFRLNTVEITVPPLRDRVEDIETIATYYAEFYARKYGFDAKKFSDQALTAIKHYKWPGNIRALRHAIERAVILSESDEFLPADFSLPDQLSSSQPPIEETTEQPNTDLNLERIEKQTIQQALKKHRYNISHAAKELGLTRAALYRRMEKHEL